MRHRFDNPHFFQETERCHGNKIQSFQDNQDVLIRKYKQDYVDFSLAKDAHKKLENEYGVKVAPYELVIGKDDEGIDSMFMVVKKINGSNLFHLDSLPDSAIEAVTRTVNGLWRHLKDAHDKKRSNSVWISIVRTNLYMAQCLAKIYLKCF